LGGVDAERALADLLELSRDVETVAILDRDWAVLASNADADGAARIAAAVADLVREAELVKPGPDAGLERLRAPTGVGTLFLLREGDLAVAATAARTAPAALVLHDLRTCLRALTGAYSDETADARA
jgi:hypothetical protein